MLLLKSDGDQEVVVEIREMLTVGRTPENDLVIRDLHVSTHHARITRRGQGLFEVEDLNSTGGTYINEQRVQRSFLKDGDVLRFATVNAVFIYTAGAQLENHAESGATLPPQARSARKVTFDPGFRKSGILTLPDGTQVPLPTTGEITVGRLPTNEVVIPDPRVSGSHARILCSGGTQFEVFDLNSTWGTSVNGIRLTHSQLRDRDVLTIGAVDCYFEIRDVPKEASLGSLG
jgi:pSer/pThr/pTyr-binding forkhead associated (FHA) protein